MGSPPPQRIAPGPGRVIVVEDEPDVAELICYLLQKEGWEVSQAPNDADALKRVREMRPDIVLLDLMVPQLNGWEVCRRLKHAQLEAEHLVALLDATGDHDDRDGASWAPASGRWCGAASPARARRRSSTSGPATWRSTATDSRSA